MHIVITNTGPVAVPFSSSKDAGFVFMLEPGEPYSLDNEKVTVANVGDNPSFMEELRDSLKNLVDVLGKFLTFWRDHSAAIDGLGNAQITARIENKGTNGLRVILGDNTVDYTVEPGTTYDASAVEYIEIRELGV
jgi:hypothetical protein